jgi:hypothetical protein
MFYSAEECNEGVSRRHLSYFACVKSRQPLGIGCIGKSNSPPLRIYRRTWLGAKENLLTFVQEM